MDTILTIAQIEAQFESEWVLVDDPQTDDALAVQKGVVLCHSKDREEVYRKAIAFRKAKGPHPIRFAMLFTGCLPEGTSIVLALL